MSDPCEDICDAIVEHLNTAQEEEPNPFDPIEFMARKPADPLAELTLEFDEIQVMLVPYADSETKIGRPKFLEVHEVSLWVVRKLQNEWTRTRMSEVVRQVIERLRGRKMAGWTYGAAETTTKFDLTQLHEKKQFMSIVRLSYEGVR